MSVNRARPRISERVLRAPRRRDEDQERDAARKFFYKRLARVSIRNTYYARTGDRCPDFIAHPTLSTSELMRDHDLLFRRDRTGFSVLYNTKSRQDLFSFLRRQYQDRRSPSGSTLPPCWQEREQQLTPGVWTRLSFVLALENPYFINFTQVPIDTNPALENFYFSNQNAQQGGQETQGVQRAVLTPPRDPDRVTGADLVRVTGPQLRVEFCEGAEQLWVRSISGEVVICRPRCFRCNALESFPLDDVDCRCAVQCPDETTEGICEREEVFLDFALLPEDKYRLVQVDAECQPVECEGMPPEVLYTELYPMPLCFIDLLFTNPTGSDTGVYPVRNLWDEEETHVVEVDYLVPFARRKTRWSYFIVPQPGWERYDDLRIESLSHEIDFVGPCCVWLADGSRAYRFLSDRRLALEAASSYHFRLRGRRPESAHERILVDRLPVASNRQVLPERKRRVCRELRNSLCENQSEPEKCRQLEDAVCGVSRRRDFSDIYVYI